MKFSTKELSILYMIMSTFSFAIMGATVKYLDTVPSIEKVFARNFVAFFISFIFVIKTDTSFLGQSVKSFFLLIVRSTFGLSGVVLIFYTISNASLADSSILMRLSPFGVAALATIFLKEKITLFKLLSLILAFSGAVIIIRPGTDISPLPILSGIAASICAAVAYILVSFLKNYEKPLTIVFFFSFFSIVVTTPFLIADCYIPNLNEVLGLIITGVAAFGGQIFLTYSYRLGKASEVSIYNYTGIVFGALIGYVVWGEVPDLFTFIGAFLIMIAGFLVYKNLR